MRAIAPASEPKSRKASKKATVARVKPDVATAKGKSRKKATSSKKAPKASHKAKSGKATGTREGSKTAQALALLHQPNGVTLAELMTTLSWQAHSVRGFISGTLGKKMDLKVISFKNEAGDRSYRIDK